MGLRRGWSLIFFLFLGLGPLQAQEKVFTAPGAQLWRDWSWQGLETRQHSGRVDLLLGSAEYAPSEDTDLLIHFNPGAPLIAGGNYQALQTPPGLLKSFPRLGTGSGAFGSPAGLELQPKAGSLWTRGQVWRDFTLEFWLYGATLAEGETILHWQGLKSSSAGPRNQSVKVSFQGRKLVWAFQNFFFSGEGEGPESLSLTGRKALLPRQWSHHTLRFDSRLGLLEYLVNGIPEASTHLTPTGKESAAALTPWIGDLTSGPLVLGPGFNGFLDEFRLSRTWQETQTLETFPLDHGVATSPIYDLGVSGSSVKQVQVRGHVPGLTGLKFFYRMANQKYYQWTFSGKNRVSLVEVQGKDESSEAYFQREEASWIPFTPGQTPFLRGAGGAGGRYVQFRVFFLPEGSGKLTPWMSEFQVVALPLKAPPAPAWAGGTGRDRGALLTWKSVNTGTCDGYVVRWGLRPGQYDLGVREIPAAGLKLQSGKNLLEYPLEGLDNYKLYYFVVTSFIRSGGERVESPFTKEFTLRPSPTEASP